MRVKLLLLMSLALAALASSMPMDSKRRLINVPPNDVNFRRHRSPQYGIKGYDAPRTPTQPLEHRVAKGQYVCGNKICDLRPGEIPPGCNGICQYPVA